MIIYLFKNPKALYNYGKPTLLLLLGNNKRLNEAHLLTTRFTEKFLLIVESYYSGGKKSFQNATVHWQCIWLPNRSDGDVQQDSCFFLLLFVFFFLFMDLVHWEDLEGLGGEEVGGGIGMGSTCRPMAVSFQCMTKFPTNKK